MMMNRISSLIILLLVLCSIIVIESRIKTTHGRRRDQYLKDTLLGEPPVFSNETLWFTQKQDHFDNYNNYTWSQRYTVLDDYFDGTGPIFVYLAGEAPMSFFGFQEVQVVNWAEQFNALYIVIEHRFYGQSYPTYDMSTWNLKYLSSQQALADAANLITTYKTENNYNSNPVVIFGCSYSGALSAWFRLKYPTIAIASVAPSGPVLAQTNYTGYYAQFENSAPTSCVSAAQQASNQVTTLLQSYSGRQQLVQTFNSCEDLEDPQDLYYFVYSIVEALGSADQMNNPPTWMLNQTCDMLTNTTDYLGNWAKIFNVGQDTTQCNDFSLFNFIREAQNVTNSPDQANRLWTWQTCVEFGYFSTTYPGTSVFPGVLNVEEQIGWCSLIYGIPDMYPNTEYTNQFYGGQDIPATNIAFTNGLLDPWHLLSVTTNNENNNILGITYEAGHCGTLIQETDIDPISLTNAREEVIAFLKGVLSN